MPYREPDHGHPWWFIRRWNAVIAAGWADQITGVEASRRRQVLLTWLSDWDLHHRRAA